MHLTPIPLYVVSTLKWHIVQLCDVLCYCRGINRFIASNLLSRNPRTLCNPNALAPYFWLVICHVASNQRRKGFLVLWKRVPAVTEVCREQAWHSNSPLVCPTDLSAFTYRADNSIWPT